MKKIYGTTLIIGNGFDLNLGMVTDYRSFFQELQNKSFFEENKNNPLLHFIQEKGEKENWYDFENIIKDYATKGKQAVYLKMIERFLPSLEQALGIDKDSFDAIKKYSPLADIASNIADIIKYAENHSEFEFACDTNIKDKSDIVKKELSAYTLEQRNLVREAMRLLTEELKIFLNKARIAEKTPTALWMLFATFGVFSRSYSGLAEEIVKYADEKGAYELPEFRIISFNYTDTITKVSNWVERQCGLPICLQTQSLGDIFYRIHGDLDSQIIFGIDDKSSVPKAFMSLRKSQNINTDAKSRFRDIIEKSERIIILGHSLCGIDFEYYENFFKENTDTEVVILYHSEEAKNSIQIGLENHGVVHKVTYEKIELSNPFVHFCKEIAEGQKQFFNRKD